MRNCLPTTGQDININSQSMSLGGCAYNVSEMLRHFGVPYTLFSPVGTGTYGDYVRACLLQKQIPVVIPTPPEDNGCCYCFVEDSGERTFASLRGAEYRFKQEWFSQIRPDEVGCAYVCGLELEEVTGSVILDYLEMHPAPILYFAPGPRLREIPREWLRRILALEPVLHLNEEEAYALAEMAEIAETKAIAKALENTGSANDSSTATGNAAVQPNVRTAASKLINITKNHIIITRGAKGAFLMEPSGAYSCIPGVPARQADTTGTGDSHIGTVISCMMLGYSIKDAIRFANRVSAAVVEHPGAGIGDDVFTALYDGMLSAHHGGMPSASLPAPHHSPT